MGFSVAWDLRIKRGPHRPAGRVVAIRARGEGRARPVRECRESRDTMRLMSRDSRLVNAGYAPTVCDGAAGDDDMNREGGHGPTVEPQDWKRFGDRYVRRWSDPAPGDWRPMTRLHVSLAGLAYSRDCVRDFAQGNRCVVELERRSTNAFDRNAIEVLGAWWRGAEQKSGRLGWVPADLARAIAEQRSSEVPLGAMPRKVSLKGPYCDLTIQILEPSENSGWWAARDLEPPGFVSLAAI